VANDEYREPQQAARKAGLEVRNETRQERAIRRAVAEEIAVAIEACVSNIKGPLFEGANAAFIGSAALAREIGSTEAS
jgi:hypothetical protein